MESNLFVRAGVQFDMSVLQCSQCSSLFSPFPPKHKCENCGSLLDYAYDFEQLKDAVLPKPFTFWKFKSYLPAVNNVVTLGEGGTPLHTAERLSKELGLKNLYLKDETRNPTNSFRDRCAALMVSNALDYEHDSVICASNGNMGASMAAYCAKSGLTCHVIVPKMVDVGKLAQMMIYDAVIEEYGETVDESIVRAESLAEETGWYQATADFNPLTVEAEKTISYEVVEQFGVPDCFVVSMGSGGTIYSLWKGFKDLQALHKIDKIPRMIGVQASGCAPIVEGFTDDEVDTTADGYGSYTRALGIFVRNPVNGSKALGAINDSGGAAVSVDDSEIFVAEQEIARLEGLFAEPSSSATIAALKKLRGQGVVDADESVVCLMTGSGLKATDVLQALAKKRKTAGVGSELSTKEKILRILSSEDTYGYDLWKKIGKTMTRAAIYQHLNDLSRRGAVTSYSRDGRKYFRITERGTRALLALDDLKMLL
ncbi:MAG: threonine synthase [Candidatus Bathyarchaeum sp.]|nr:MAG: threonine synthase [Candidatus Bathyarchaeum sp.]